MLSCVRSIAGAYSAVVTVDSEVFRRFQFVVHPEVCPRQTCVYGNGLDNGIFARKPATFVIEFRELGGSLITDRMLVKESQIDVKIVGPKDFVDAKVGPAQEEGTWQVTYEPQVHGEYEIGVLYKKVHLGASPFTVQVEKPPKAGSIWQAKFEEEAEKRRKQREQERLEEIERAKKNFAEHAAEVTRFAREKQEQELAEKKRLAAIDEHMEAMRGEEGQKVRAEVISRVKAKAIEAEFEPLKEGAETTSAGKAWAIAQQKEHEERVRQREAERQAEIEKAKQNYQEHLHETKEFVLNKEKGALGE